MELTEILYRHMSPEIMVSCGKISVKLISDMDPREFSRFFLHQSLERYHGYCDIVQFLQSFITHLKMYPSLHELLPDLQRTQTAQRKATEVKVKVKAGVRIFCLNYFCYLILV